MDVLTSTTLARVQIMQPPAVLVFRTPAVVRTSMEVPARVDTLRVVVAVVLRVAAVVAPRVAQAPPAAAEVRVVVVADVEAAKSKS
jgi:hypothetical protein